MYTTKIATMAKMDREIKRRLQFEYGFNLEFKKEKNCINVYKKTNRPMILKKCK